MVFIFKWLKSMFRLSLIDQLRTRKRIWRETIYIYMTGMWFRCNQKIQFRVQETELGVQIRQSRVGCETRSLNFLSSSIKKPLLFLFLGEFPVDWVSNVGEWGS